MSGVAVEGTALCELHVWNVTGPNQIHYFSSASPELLHCK